MVSVQDHIALSGIGRWCFASGCKSDSGGSTAGAIEQLADELSKFAAVHLLQLDVCDRSSVESALSTLPAPGHL